MISDGRLHHEHVVTVVAIAIAIAIIVIATTCDVPFDTRWYDATTS